MSEIEYDIPKTQYNSPVVATKSGLTGFVLKLGIVKTENQARGLFLVVIVLAVIYIGYSFFHSNSRDIVPASEFQKIDQNKFITQ